MIKKTLYPKTKRIQYKNRVVITEKLDGSNIGFFKVNGDLIIAQRNNIFLMNELEENKQMLYRGLKGWLDEYGEGLKDKLMEGSGFFGEWIGMGKIKYPDLDKKVYMFAKANYVKGEIRNLYLEHVYNTVQKAMTELESVDLVDVSKRKESQVKVNKVYDILDNFKNELIREKIKNRRYK